MGGSQHLTRFVGKAKATEMCLTGRITDAHEAERCGLVSHCKGVSFGGSVEGCRRDSWNVVFEPF